MRKSIYLAGGMHSDWREGASQWSNSEFIDPKKMNEAIADPSIYTRNDLEAIQSCDGVLAFMDAANPSGYGLSVEVGYAHALGKPIAFVDGMGDDWRSRYFGMHRHIASVQKDFCSAVFWLMGEMHK